MGEENLINQTIENAYNNLKNIAELNIFVSNGYFGLIIPENKYYKLSPYVDKIINIVFEKICNDIRDKLKNINTSELRFIEYKSFSSNNPSENLINDCYKIIDNFIQNKKDSDETNLLEYLNSLKGKHELEDINKSLDTIFDILLNCYLFSIK